LAILSGAKLATLILLLGIPMIDGVITIARRLSRHQPIYLGDGQHFHHQLLNRGWSRRSIALIYWFFSFILGIFSLFLNSSQKLYVFLGIFLLFFSLFIHFSRRS
jgi:UDP-N-acetylmuramyl pentapeptide phosphotransferase/UDP-N-acetylglucosamine-1-phosphate transferase